MEIINFDCVSMSFWGTLVKSFCFQTMVLVTLLVVDTYLVHASFAVFETSTSRHERSFSSLLSSFQVANVPEHRADHTQNISEGQLLTPSTKKVRLIFRLEFFDDTHGNKQRENGASIPRFLIPN